MEDLGEDLGEDLSSLGLGEVSSWNSSGLKSIKDREAVLSGETRISEGDAAMLAEAEKLVTTDAVNQTPEVMTKLVSAATLAKSIGPMPENSWYTLVAASLAAATGDTESALLFARSLPEDTVLKGVLVASIYFRRLETFTRFIEAYPAMISEANQLIAWCADPAYTQVALATYAAQHKSPHELFIYALEASNQVSLKLIADWAAAAGTPVKATRERLEIAILSGSVDSIRLLATDAARFAALVASDGASLVRNMIEACVSDCELHECVNFGVTATDHVATAKHMISAGVPETRKIRTWIASREAARAANDLVD